MGLSLLDHLLQFSGLIRQVRSFCYWQSAFPSWPGAPNYEAWPYLSLEENFGIVLRGAFTLTGGRGCHVQGSQSLCVLCLFSYLTYGYLLLQVMPTLYTYGSLDTW